MSFKKPFRAVPVRLGPYYRGLERRKQVITAVKVLVLALAGGAAVGGSMALYEQGALSQIPAIVRDFAASVGLVRRSTPQPGDYWSGCNEARAAGVAPLYKGEPGYRPQMDGDNDGVACEPYHGY